MTSGVVQQLYDAMDTCAANEHLGTCSCTEIREAIEVILRFEGQLEAKSG